jgi:hypothetical protein
MVNGQIEKMKTKETHSYGNPFIMDPFASADHQNIVRRHRITLDFIGDQQLGRVLDIGERNPFTLRLEKKSASRLKIPTATWI